MPQKPRLWPVWLVLILVVLLIGALAFGLWEQYRQQQSLQDRFQQLSQQTSEVRESQSSLVGSRQERLNQFASQLEKQRETIEQQREKLNTQERQIEHNARSLLGLGKRTRTDWLLAEAEYLLRLANQRLQMERDHRGALRILETADEILAETDEAGVYPVRQQLAREILALRTLEPVDRTGLYLQLEAAMGMASELDSEQLFTADQTGSQSPANAGNQQTTEDGWRVVWQRVLNTLNQMVIIRRLDEPAQAMLSPQQSAQARLHLQLMFEQAAVALLQEDQSTYRRALRRAENWLDQWYDADDKRVETLQQLIDDAAEQRIRVTLPDISESLSLLKARIEGRLEGGEAPAQEEGPDENGTSDGEPQS
jgi:uroporphyrin-3 C-methyltransferase